MCSYFNFKGWESSHIILHLDSISKNDIMFGEMKNTMFIALTRVNSFSGSRSFTRINSRAEYNYLSKFF